jgi:hypothetical protein
MVPNPRHNIKHSGHNICKTPQCLHLDFLFSVPQSHCAPLPMASKWRVQSGYASSQVITVHDASNACVSVITTPTVAAPQRNAQTAACRRLYITGHGSLRGAVPSYQWDSSYCMTSPLYVAVSTSPSKKTQRCTSRETNV